MYELIEREKANYAVTRMCVVQCVSFGFLRLGEGPDIGDGVTPFLVGGTGEESLRGVAGSLWASADT